MNYPLTIHGDAMLYNGHDVVLKVDRGFFLSSSLYRKVSDLGAINMI